MNKLFIDIKQGLTFFIYDVSLYITSICRDIKWDKICKPLEPIMLDLLFVYNRKRIQMNRLTTWYYNEYTCVRFTTDFVSIVFNTIRQLLVNIVSLFIYRRIEPFDSTVNLFMCIPQSKLLHISYEDTNRPTVLKNEYSHSPTIFGHIIAHMSNKPHDDVSLFMKADICGSAAVTMFSVYNNINDGIVIIRRNPMYIIKTTTPLRTIAPVIALPNQSRVEFYEIRYMCEGMTESIVLNIPQSMYYVGNELFSPTFMLWLLEMQPVYVKYTFDLNYELTLLDDSMEKLYLASDQYIRLERYDYVVCRL